MRSNQTSRGVKRRVIVYGAMVFMVGLMCASCVAAGEAPAEPSVVPPIKQVEGAAVTDAAYKDSSAQKPLVIKSQKEAEAYFTDDGLAKLKSGVDFDKQIVLVFAWHGSGGDRITHAVAESYPEQIFFTYTRGRTKDLHEHVQVYALRSNVKWSVRVP